MWQRWLTWWPEAVSDMGNRCDASRWSLGPPNTTRLHTTVLNTTRPHNMNADQVKGTS